MPDARRSGGDDAHHGPVTLMVRGLPMPAPQGFSLTMPPGQRGTPLAAEGARRPSIVQHPPRLDPRAQVAMGVAAAGGVFHQPGSAGPENLGAPVAHADL